MSRSGNVYWGETGAPAVPAAVCLVDLNARTALGDIVPVYVPGVLGDQVFVAEAIFDPSNGGSLSVVAASSDQVVPTPALALGAFGDLASNVALVNGLAYVAPLAAPPAKVRVLSAERGVAELQVVTGSRVATGVTLSADRSSPQAPGTSVVFMAQGQGASSYQYRFLLDSGGGFQVVRDWSTSPVWVLGGPAVVGDYLVQVEVWAGLTPSGPDVASVAIPFRFTIPPATSATLVSNLASPQDTGTEVTFNAACGGTTSPCDYQFWSFDGTTWTIVQPWGGGASWLMPASTPAGTYAIVAEVRTSPLVVRDIYTNVITSFVIRTPAPPPPAPATGATLDASLASPLVAGTEVTFSAACSGTAAPCDYQFWAFDGAAWAIVQPWGGGASWLMPSSTPAGTYAIVAEVRTSSLVTRDVYTNAITGFTLMVPTVPPPAPATGATLDASLASPQLTGTEVTFSAACSGTAAPCDYQFWSFDGAAWAIVQPWGGGASWLMPASTPAGTYAIVAEVRTSSLVTRDVYTNVVAGFTLTAPVVPPPAPATGASLDASLASPQLTGTEVTFTAACSGTAAPCDYQFWTFDGATWTVVQPWGGGASWLMPASTLAGTYAIAAEVRTSPLVVRDVWSQLVLGYVIQ
ncbi:MAG: hypothetical protein IPO09_18610 [Anaeromyxobacter sp.]|nr:hypothetical protein [Anaeromyxobacter sp.]